MQSLHAFLGFSLVAASVALVACGGSDLDKNCTLIGCDIEGTSVVQFSLSQAGAYRFELSVDGKAVRCTATLPLREGVGGCDDERVTLTQSGSQLATDQQSIGPIGVRGKDTQRIEVQAFRDEAPIGTAQFDVKHTESAGPNGPGCDPEVCREASGGDLK